MVMAAIAQMHFKAQFERALIDGIVSGGGRQSRGRHSPRHTIVKDLTRHPRSKSEALIIEILEKITGKPFPTVLPAWLLYKGRQMELDGYSEELGIAIEFSGPQHTKYYASKESYENYMERVEKDKEKIRLCKEHNVKLFVIDMSIPRHHWREYLLSRLFDIGWTDQKPINYMREYVAPVYTRVN